MGIIELPVKKYGYKILFSGLHLNYRDRHFMLLRGCFLNTPSFRKQPSFATGICMYGSIFMACFDYPRISSYCENFHEPVPFSLDYPRALW